MKSRLLAEVRQEVIDRVACLWYAVRCVLFSLRSCLGSSIARHFVPEAGSRGRSGSRGSRPMMGRGLEKKKRGAVMCLSLFFCFVVATDSLADARG